MFGVKTRIKNLLLKATNRQLIDPVYAKTLFRFFGGDEKGHRAEYETADLGYGFLHYSLVRTQKPDHILCIGSRQGFIPALLAQACQENGSGWVHFVDPGYGRGDPNHWTGIGYWRTKAGQTCFQRFGLTRLTHYQMTSAEFAAQSKLRFGYIYVDGDHSYLGAKADYNRFWPRLCKGGFMAFHDVSVKRTKREGEYGVWRLWAELGPTGKIIFPHPTAGLGMIQKT